MGFQRFALPLIRDICYTYDCGYNCEKAESLVATDEERKPGELYGKQSCTSWDYSGKNRINDAIESVIT